MHDAMHYWLALQYLPAVGPVRLRGLLQRYPSPQALFEEGPDDPSLAPPLRDALRQPDWAAVEKDRAWASSERTILTLDDARYPRLLAEIYDAPPILYAHGVLECLENPQLGVVGSRNPSPLGSETAREFAQTLSAAGMTVTSGLALGVDAAAHQGALDAGGPTIAVFGTGPDRIYPARHRDLAHAIIAGGGLLLSEFPPGTSPAAGHFPRRNRIISGLSLGTLVVEAALRSGSLITARSAAEQGREVFAIPGSIHNPLAKGCHRLIRDGAKLVETAQDVLEELIPQLRAQLAETAPATASANGPLLDADYQGLLGLVDFSATAVDVLVERSGLTADAVSSMLLILELEGYVVSAAGGTYTRTGKESS